MCVGSTYSGSVIALPLPALELQWSEIRRRCGRDWKSCARRASSCLDKGLMLLLPLLCCRREWEDSVLLWEVLFHSEFPVSLASPCCFFVCMIALLEVLVLTLIFSFICRFSFSLHVVCMMSPFPLLVHSLLFRLLVVIVRAGKGGAAASGDPALDSIRWTSGELRFKLPVSSSSAAAAPSPLLVSLPAVTALSWECTAWTVTG